MRYCNFNAILSGLVLCLLLTSVGIAKDSRAASPVIVTVNGVNVTQKQIDKLIKKDVQMAIFLGKTPSKALMHNLMLRAADEIMEKVVINERFAAKGIEVSDQEVDQGIEKIAKSKNMTRQDFINKALPSNNISYVDFRGRVALGLKFDQLIELEAGSKAFKVGDSEARRHYSRNKDQFTSPAKVKASHIMIKYPAMDKDSKSDVKFAMGKIAEMAKSGKDFAVLAGEYSEDISTKEKGGDLGFFTKEIMPPQIAAIAFSLKAGEVSEVIEMPYGCHLIKVFEVDEGGLMSFDKVKGNIITRIEGDKKDTYSRSYIENMMARARIRWAGGKRPEPMEIKEIN